MNDPRIRCTVEGDCEKVHVMINEFEDFSLDQDTFSRIFFENLKDSSIHYNIAEEEAHLFYEGKAGMKKTHYKFTQNLT